MENNSGGKEYVLETAGLSKKYKDFYAVRNVCMHVEKGDVYGFVGENGAGKTTVIRLITGLAAPTEGTFYLFGEERDDAMKRRRVAGIVENVSLNRSMTALENMRYQCMISGITKTDAEIDAVLAEVGLGDAALAKKKVRNFSLGMRQRLGIATVVIQDPEFVILDEPMNGLDPQGFIDMRETVKRLNARGITFLISSHILSELDIICTKVGFISKGELIEEILVEDLHKKSSARTVLAFPGSEEAEQAVEKLSKYAFFADREVEGSRITVYGETDINEILAVLVSEQIRISSVNVKEKSVEDYYIEKVRR